MPGGWALLLLEQFNPSTKTRKSTRSAGCLLRVKLLLFLTRPTPPASTLF